MHRLAPLAAAAAMILIGQPARAATVTATGTASTLLGVFGPGTYQYTTSGVVSLAGPVGSGFDLDADGRPVTPVTVAGYNYFNPNGADNDQGTFGTAGPGFNLGALIGSYDNVSYFLLGTGGTFTVATPATALFGFVNDTSHANNAGAFTFTVDTATAAVPEPATWAMLFIGFGAVGGAMRRRGRLPLAG